MNKFFIWFALVLFLLLPENALQFSRIFRRSISGERRKFQCGTSTQMATDLITEGYQVKLGEWPWHGALFHRKNRRSKEYKCGVTLIDQNYALTAAHCVVNRDSGYTLSAKVVSVDFGYVKLFGQSRHGQSHEIHEIILHPEFDFVGNKHDIAILLLRTSVRLSNYTMPICLPHSGSDDGVHDIVGRHGSVVGFGMTEDESSDHSNNLQQTKLPVVQHAECLESNPDLFSHLIYPGMICAGFRNGTSVCNGDSGGGMYFPDGGKWTLRGITSFSGTRHAGSNKCDVANYAGFMNVKYYLPWIRNEVYGEQDGGSAVVGLHSTSNSCGKRWANTTVTAAVQTAAANEYPWIVELLDERKDVVCVGSLVSPKYVLTSKFCDKSFYLTSVRLGPFDRKCETNFSCVEITIKSIFRHQVNDVDIALVQLSKEASLNRDVNVICLPTSTGRVNESDMILSDFGLASSFSANQPEPLQHVKITAQPRVQCGIIPSDHDRQVCASIPRGASVSRGAPVQSTAERNDDNDRMTLIAVASWVVNDGTSYVYTEVAPHVEWVRGILEGASV